MKLLTAALVTSALFTMLPNPARPRMSAEVKTFKGKLFTHLVYSPETHYLYVGGVNRIYQLKRSNLSKMASLKTGPLMDNRYCDIEACVRRTKVRTEKREHCLSRCATQCNLSNIPAKECRERTTETMVRGMTRDRDFLYVCYNVRLGRCQKLRLNNVAQVVVNSSEPIVCANPDTNVNMLVAGYPQLRRKQALYMAATKCNISYGTIENDIPSLSIRRLDTFDLIQLNSDKSSWLKRDSLLDVRRHMASYFEIFYRYVFSYQQARTPLDGQPRAPTNFVYHLTVQPEPTGASDNMWVSRLGRICENDPYFNSYIELTLRCTATVSGSPIDYNLAQAATLGRVGSAAARAMGIQPHDQVLFVAFRSALRNLGLERSGHGAVCAFSMAEIQELYHRITINCLRDGGFNVGPVQFKEYGFCTKLFTSQKAVEAADLGYCHFNKETWPMAGDTKTQCLNKRPVLTFPDVEVDSILAGPVSDFTVLQLGTHDGRLLQFELGRADGHWQPHRLDALKLGPNPVLQLVRTEERQFVYALTTEKVAKVRLYDCAQFRSCNACQAARNPHCGWCVVSGRCLTQAECEMGRDSWLSYAKGINCPSISKMDPTGIQRHDVTAANHLWLKLTLANIPLPLLYNCTPPQCKLQCQFSTEAMGLKWDHEQRQRSHARDASMAFFHRTTVLLPTGMNYHVKCMTPAMRLMPVLPPGVDHVPVRVSLVMDGKPIVWTKFYLFSCRTYNSCTACVSNRFQCAWCSLSNQCNSYTRTETYCSYTYIIRHQREVECPRFDRKAGRLIRKPSGRPFRNVRLSVQPSVQTLNGYMKEFFCALKCPGRQEKLVPAVKDERRSILKCAEFRLSYDEEVGRMHCELGVKFENIENQMFYMENPENVSVELYKCGHMVDSCGDCLIELRKAYRCGWCNSAERCSRQPDCPRDWLPRGSTCPNPNITHVMPMNATQDSAVVVTLEGRNLGHQYSDVADNVVLMVKGDARSPIPCKTFEAGYKAGRRVRCRIAAEKWRSASSGFFQLQVAGKFAARSPPFAFLRPRVAKVRPQFGPVAGGTPVCLEGANLAIGSFSGRRVVWRTVAHERLECALRHADNARICCVTAAAAKKGSSQLELTFDGSEPVAQVTAAFEYRPNPTVATVARTKSVVSGGLPVLVTGANFLVPSSARLELRLGRRTVSSECRRNASSMHCLTPSVHRLLPTAAARVRRSAHAFSYGFRMDGVLTERNRGEFEVFPDPHLDRFPGGRLVRALSKAAGEESLKLSGSDLLGIEAADIKVRVGKRRCGVVTLETNRLICMLARPQAPESAQVTVQIGFSLRYELGELEYRRESPVSHQMMIIILVVMVGLVLFVVVLVFLCVCRCQSRVRHRMQAKMDQMMNQMEMKVASECKEAFAELQTDMSEVTHALAVSSSSQGCLRLPYRTYTYFCINQLFPNQDHSIHPVLSKLEVPRANFNEFDIGFRRLSDLLKNRTFVVVVVRALEAQTSFTLRDRSNFASLLSSALQSKMEYFTDLLKVLLEDLIKHSVERRKEKLLFRRSESVAEKMLANWLTFLLYDYLLDRAGEPLYLLTQAIWLQISRGPVDAITYDSRYALSDEKLLRESVDYDEVHLLLIDPNGTFETERNNDQDWQLYVKVLDCDTITQAKEKILFAVYKHNAFSERPSADDIDLELIEAEEHGAPVVKKSPRIPHNYKKNHPEKACLTAKRRLMQDLDETNETVRHGPNRTAMRCLNTLRHYRRLWGLKGQPMEKEPLMVKCSLRCSQFDSNSLKANENSSLVNSTSNLIGAVGDHFEVGNNATPNSGTLGHSSSYAHFPSTLRTVDDTKIADVHLVKGAEEQREETSGRTSKIVSEACLNRLLVTKNCVQRYIDNFLRTVFAVAPPEAGGNHCDMVLPLCIKYIFDFLDEQALIHNIADPEVIHVWKSNCLPLRFWVGVVKNPNCIFDLQKTPAVDACLSVVAQTLMESCNWSKTQLSKESPSSKLLFARDMDSYRELVLNYYRDIKSIPAISDQDINAHLIAHSNKHINDFNGSSAFNTLYTSYICKYKKQIEDALETDDAAKRQRLASALQEVHHYLEQSQAVC